ncbi:MAG: hypothetical protein K2G45_03540 [Lachnospiraceae bacterium]|nr:hypothetical protein [Lachnospiraceae bacterium]
MKLKYFIRGLGTGIIFSAIILLVSYMTGGAYKISDEEIIKRAEKLGMVQDEKDIIASPASPDKDKNNTSSDSEVVSNKTTTEASTTEDPTTEASTTEDPTTEERKTEEPTTERQTTENPTTESGTTENPGEGDYVKATITVQAGMGSYEVASLLQNAGIIKDANDFDLYLNRNGYSTKIRIKSQEFNSKMSYEEIAKLLVKEN